MKRIMKVHPFLMKSRIIKHTIKAAFFISCDNPSLDGISCRLAAFVAMLIRLTLPPLSELATLIPLLSVDI